MRLCFVRFGCSTGACPAGGKSKNSLTGKREKGVSVYEALERDGKYQILLPRVDPTSIATLSMCYNVAQGLWGKVNHPLYEVDGTLVGFGSDGEPLLKDVRTVKRILL